MKRFISIILFFLCSIPFFAHDGSLSGEGRLKTASTKWFDIIYPEACTKTASILFDKADDLYLEITASLGIEPDFRMSVVVTPGTEQFNAYFTNYPYNHIVVYDTAVISQLEVFSETICSTFKHELTHAVTLNMSSLKFIQKIMGDPVNPANIIVSSGMAEGATLCSESITGEGRLNNTISMAPVIQAKLENQFPGYFDVTGAGTAYPSGSFYEFNGAFHDWLQKKYGMEKYSQFWYSAANMGGNSICFTIEQVFKNTYGISLNTAWNLCFEEYKVPDIPGNPVAAGIVKDFFVPDGTDYSIQNKKGSLFSCLTKTDKGIFYLDEETWDIYFLDLTGDDGDRLPAKLLNFKNVLSISASKDSRFVVLNYLTTEGANYKKRIAVYDTEKKSLSYVNENGIQNGTVVKNQNDYYLVCQKFKSQNYELNVKKILFGKNKIKGFEDFDSIAFPLETNPSAITFAGKDNGEIAFIKKQGLSYSICKTSVTSLKDISEYSLPEGYFIQNLCDNGDRLTFTYAHSDTMARIGYLDLKKNQFEFDKRDLSGGVYYPVLLNDDEILYVGKFYRSNRLLTMKCDNGDRLTSTPKKSSLPENPDAENPFLQEAVDRLTEASVNYNPFSNYLHGLLLPACSIQSLSYDENHRTGNYSIPFGLTYITSNPWDGNTISISAGYGSDTNSGAIQFVINDESWLTSSISLEAEFDKYGFKQTNDSLLLSKSFLMGKHSVLKLQSQSIIHYGRSNLNLADYSSNLKTSDSFFGNAASDDMTNYLYGSQIFSCGFQNLIYTQPGKYNRLGYSVQGYGIYSINSKADFSKIYTNGFDAAFSLNIYLPRLLPVSNLQGYTYNLPVVISASTLGINNSGNDILIASSNNALSTDDFDGFNLGIYSVLFASEIQKGLFNCTGLYIQDFVLSMNYKTGFNIDAIVDQPLIFYTYDQLCKVFNGEKSLNHKLYLKAKIDMTPNIGSIGSAYSFALFGDGGVAFKNPSAMTPFADFGISYSF